MQPFFSNRQDAGRQLAAQLRVYAERPSTVVLGIPRGGIVVAFEVAQALHLPLDVFVVRKLGVPGQEELAMGAAAGGSHWLNYHLVNSLGISKLAIQAVLLREQQELRRRGQLYRAGSDPHAIDDQTVLLVDDGFATGSSARAAIRILKRQNPAAIIAAVPVASLEAYRSLKTEIDEVVCLYTPSPFCALSCWYDHFSPTRDKEVCTLLQRARVNLPIL